MLALLIGLGLIGLGPAVDAVGADPCASTCSCYVGDGPQAKSAVCYRSLEGFTAADFVGIRKLYVSGGRPVDFFMAGCPNGIWYIQLTECSLDEQELSCVICVDSARPPRSWIYSTIVKSMKVVHRGGDGGSGSKSAPSLKDRVAPTDPTTTLTPSTPMPSPVTPPPAVKTTTTKAPSTPTPQPTTAEPITRVPVTRAPITRAPITRAPVTRAPITRAPVTRAPVTRAPITRAPVTRAPVTRAPSTRAPVTRAPVTRAPITRAPVTRAPVTRAPVTRAPVTRAPTTKAAPTKAAPTKATPTKSAPTKAAPTKAAPTTAAPTNAAPTKAAPTKAAPTKAAPTKAAPTKAAPAKAVPGPQSVVRPARPQPPQPQPARPQPVQSQPTRPQPSAPAKSPARQSASPDSTGSRSNGMVKAAASSAKGVARPGATTLSAPARPSSKPTSKGPSREPANPVKQFTGRRRTHIPSSQRNRDPNTDLLPLLFASNPVSLVAVSVLGVLLKEFTYGYAAELIGTITAVFLFILAGLVAFIKVRAYQTARSRVAQPTPALLMIEEPIQEMPMVEMGPARLALPAPPPPLETESSTMRRRRLRKARPNSVAARLMKRKAPTPPINPAVLATVSKEPGEPQSAIGRLLQPTWLRRRAEVRRRAALARVDRQERVERAAALESVQVWAASSDTESDIYRSAVNFRVTSALIHLPPAPVGGSAEVGEDDWDSINLDD